MTHPRRWAPGVFRLTLSQRAALPRTAAMGAYPGAELPAVLGDLGIIALAICPGQRFSDKPGMAMTNSDHHRKRMKALVAFSAASFDTEFPSPFGSAIYDERSGVLVAQAYDTVMRMCDPTNHAEMNAIRDAARELQRLSLRGCTLYSTCEPCPMCISACIWAEIDTVVFGASTLDDANLYWPQASDLPPEELVAHMVLEPRCRLIPHVERSLCRDLFTQCDGVRMKRSLQLPPHRHRRAQL